MPDKLSDWAVTEKNSEGRSCREKPHHYRSDFERDRDRIIHSAAFRRLEGKTQVFTPGLDDYYRTRLTHSIEVAQIGRTIAKKLDLNEVLTEAVCLAHDLGHPPFGHAGEKVLDNLMADSGGFEHNRQTLRIVELIEHPYHNFKGLNLMYETRLSLAKHAGPYDKPPSGNFAETNCSLEGQIANVADRIAYNCHDLEDGTRARLLDETDLLEIEIFRHAHRRIGAENIDDKTIRRTRTIKAIIDELVGDCIETSGELIGKAGITSLEDVHNNYSSLILLSPKNRAELEKLERVLLEKLYLNDELKKTAARCKNWLTTLFHALCDNKQLMPGYYRSFTSTQTLQRTACDYIAGMTDRFCLKTLAGLNR